MSSGKSDFLLFLFNIILLIIFANPKQQFGKVQFKDELNHNLEKKED